MVRIVIHSPITTTKCPFCKKEINAIQIENNIQTYLNKEDQYKTSIRLFGCPVCKLVFWSKN